MLTKEIIVSIILAFLKEHNLTQEEIAERINVERSSISNWKRGRVTNITKKHYKKIIGLLDEFINKKYEDKFYSYLVDKLYNRGFDKRRCQLLLERDNSVYDRLETLINGYESSQRILQHSFKFVTSVISRVRAICRLYADYFKISETKLTLENQNLEYVKWIIGSSDKQDDTLVMQQNYLILNFPNNYRVALAITNYVFDPIVQYGDAIRRLKDKNKIDLIIIFTDNEVEFDQQKYFMETHNLFFETIARRDLNKVKIQNVSIEEMNALPEVKDALFYAQVIFERLAAFFNVIRNEIIFKEYDNMRDGNVVKNLSDNNDILKGFVDKILIKDILKYSYLSRHTIYFERTRLREKVEKVLNKSKKEKLNVVMKLCYPNSFLSSAIYDKCEKLLLFTSSYCSNSIMKKMNEQSNNCIFTDNIQLNLCSMNPSYISNQYYEEISGKVDLIILGFGMGSSLINLTEYLRHIKSWLFPEGMLFISFANADSIIQNKQYANNEILETTPLFFSDYWQYTTKDNIKFLSRVKKYSIEKVAQLISTYVDVQDCYTYPLLSGIVHFNNGDRAFNEELREIDKKYSISKKSHHGHFINVIGKVNTKSNKKSMLYRNRGVHIQNIIMNSLDEMNIQYEIITHAITIDTQNLLRTLVENGQDINQFDLIKTVILCKDGSNGESLLEYVAMAREYEVNLEAYKGTLLPEKKVIHYFGGGSISPLVLLPEVISFTKCVGSAYLLESDKLAKEYVIFSSGIASESVKIRRQDFIEIMKKISVQFTAPYSHL